MPPLNAMYRTLSASAMDAADAATSNAHHNIIGLEEITVRQRPATSVNVNNRNNKHISYKKRQVTFLNQVQVYECTTTTTTTTTTNNNQGNDQQWYTPLELEDIHKDRLQTNYESGNGMMVLDDEEYCTRGLEALWDHRSKAEQILSVQETLVEARWLQEEGCGDQDDRLLAIIYSEYTQQAVAEAHSRALQDHDAAVRVHQGLVLCNDDQWIQGDDIADNEHNGNEHNDTIISQECMDLARLYFEPVDEVYENDVHSFQPNLDYNFDYDFRNDVDYNNSLLLSDPELQPPTSPLNMIVMYDDDEEEVIVASSKKAKSKGETQKRPPLSLDASNKTKKQYDDLPQQDDVHSAVYNLGA